MTFFGSYILIYIIPGQLIIHSYINVNAVIKLFVLINYYCWCLFKLSVNLPLEKGRIGILMILGDSDSFKNLQPTI